MIWYILGTIAAIIVFYIARTIIIANMIYGNYIAYESYLFNQTVIDYIQPITTMQTFNRIMKFSKSNFNNFVTENLTAIRKYLFNPFVWNRWRFFSDFDSALQVKIAVNSGIAVINEIEYVNRMGEFILQLQEEKDEEA